MTSPTATSVNLTAATATAPAKVEIKYQHYHYAKAATQMITPTGKKFSFVNYKLVTADPEIISFLDEQIAAGLNVVTKGALLTSKESDPMRAIKDAAIEEYKKEQAELAMNKALGINPDMGSTSAKGKPFSPMSTTELTNAGVSSTATAATSSK